MIHSLTPEKANLRRVRQRRVNAFVPAIERVDVSKRSKPKSRALFDRGWDLSKVVVEG